MEDEKRSISKSRRIWEETEKMWGIAGPAILLSVSQYSLEFVTSAFVGHLGAFELAAVSIIHNLVQGFVYGLMHAALARSQPVNHTDGSYEIESHL